MALRDFKIDTLKQKVFDALPKDAQLDYSSLVRQGRVPKIVYRVMGKDLVKQTKYRIVFHGRNDDGYVGTFIGRDEDGPGDGYLIFSDFTNGKIHRNIMQLLSSNDITFFELFDGGRTRRRNRIRSRKRIKKCTRRSSR